MPLSTTAREELAIDLANCETMGDERDIREAWCARHGVTLTTSYGVCPAGGRKTRKDAGRQRVNVDQAALQNAVALTVQSDMPAQLAIMCSGLHISSATLRRHLRKLGLSREEVKTNQRIYRSWEAAYSNALHEMDDSVSKLYYVHRSDGRIRRFEGGVAPYKNREKPDLVKLQLLVVKDSKSRVVYARYYRGKRAVNWLDFLWRAWTQKPDYEFYGLPDAVYCDQDTVFKSEMIVSALAEERLNVKILRTLPYSPESKGKVERGIGTLAQGIEKMWESMPLEDCRNVDDMNRILEDYLRWFGRQRSGTTHEAPFARWHRNLPAGRAVRILPDQEILRYLQMERVTRTIDAYLRIVITDREGAPHWYSLGGIQQAREWGRQRVDVLIYPGDYSTATVRYESGAEVTVSEAGEPFVNDMGNFEGGYATERGRLIAEYSAMKAVSKPRFADYIKREDSAVVQMPPRTEVVESPMFEREPVKLEPMQARKVAVRMLGREMTDEEKAAFYECFTSGSLVTEAEVREWIKTIISKGAGDEGEQQAVAG